MSLSLPPVLAAALRGREGSYHQVQRHVSSIFKGKKKKNSSLRETKASHTEYPPLGLFKRRQKSGGSGSRAPGGLNRRRSGEGPAAPHDPGEAVPEGRLP